MQTALARVRWVLGMSLPVVLLVAFAISQVANLAKLIARVRLATLHESSRRVQFRRAGQPAAPGRGPLTARGWHAGGLRTVPLGRTRAVRRGPAGAPRQLRLLPGRRCRSGRRRVTVRADARRAVAVPSGGPARGCHRRRRRCGDRRQRLGDADRPWRVDAAGLRRSALHQRRHALRRRGARGPRAQPHGHLSHPVHRAAGVGRQAGHGDLRRG